MDLVEWFADDVYRHFMLNPPFYPRPVTQKRRPLSFDETSRIHRALYRVELYCQLFTKERPVNHRTLAIRQQLIRHWVPWEREEFHCIYTYLTKRISVIVDEVADHDIEIGEFYIANDPRSPYSVDRSKDHLLSYGLHFVQILLTLPTYTDKRLVVANYRGLHDGFIGQTLRSLWVDLDPANPDAFDMENRLHRKDCLGPGEGWLWTYAPGSYTVMSAHDKLRADLREWCYCMWDKERLNWLERFRKPWDLDHFSQWRFKAKEDIEARVENNEAYLRDRETIRRMGGTGYWTPDWNWIFWPSGFKPSPPKKVRFRSDDHVTDWVLHNG